MGATRPLRSALLRLCRLLLLLLGFHVSTSAAWNLVLLHTNDVHARVEETNKMSGKCGNNSACIAGVARRSTMIQKIRSAESNVLLLDAGDQFQGSAWFSYYKGGEAAFFMNKLRYDAMTLGNHEFDNRVDGLLKPFMQQINFPLLSANIKTDETLAATFGKHYQPYKILNVGSEKVGVVGYTSRETPVLSKPGPHLYFEDEVKVLQLEVNKLQHLGITKIIALGHSGFTVDQEIAKKVRGVDVVIGGHSNTFLYTGSPPSSEVPAGPYPFMVTSDDGRRVPVVQAYAYGKYLGCLNVTFDNAGNVLRSVGNPILLDSSIPQDPAVLADVEKWKKNLSNYSAQVVGKTLVSLLGESECRSKECNLGNLICDAMLDNTVGYSEEQQWNHVNGCILNGGSIRASIDENAKNGLITMEDLIAVSPFGGTCDLVLLKGSTLRKAFEHSVKRYGETNGEFLQVSGFQVEFDMSKPPDHRVKSLNVLCTYCRVPSYEPVQDQTLYKVVMPSYLVVGGDGFSVIKDEMLKHDSGDLDVSVLSNYIAERKKVYPFVEGRIKIYNSALGLREQTSPLVLLVSLVSLGLLWTLCGSI